MGDNQPTVPDGPPQVSGLAQFVTLCLVMVAGGAGAKFGAWLAGPAGFWVVGSLAGIAVAVTSGLVTKTFRPRDWSFFALGPVGCLAGMQLSQWWLATEHEGSRQVLDFMGAVGGTCVGFAAAVVVQRLLGTRRSG